MRQVDESEALTIKRMREQHKMSLSQISLMMNRCRVTVRKILCGQFGHRKKRRVSNKIAARRSVIRKLAMQIRTVGHRRFPAYVSSRGIRDALQRKTGESLSRRHICKELKAAGLRAYKRPRVPTRNPQQLGVRMAFARECLQRPLSWFQSICFSDECWLTCNEHTTPFQWSVSRRNVLPLERKSKWNVASVLCWACVGL